MAARRRERSAVCQQIRLSGLGAFATSIAIFARLLPRIELLYRAEDSLVHGKYNPPRFSEAPSQLLNFSTFPTSKLLLGFSAS